MDKKETLFPGTPGDLLKKSGRGQLIKGFVIGEEMKAAMIEKIFRGIF